MISLTSLSTILRKPALDAHRRAAVRRSDVSLVALYGSQARKTSEHGAGCCQIAVPGGGPAMRGGVQARLDPAHWCRRVAICARPTPVSHSRCMGYMGDN
jgi:hypothetical protein